MAEVNFVDKDNIYRNTKNSMIKLFAGIIAEETAPYHDPKVYEALYNRGGFQLVSNQLPTTKDSLILTSEHSPISEVMVDLQVQGSH